MLIATALHRFSRVLLAPRCLACGEPGHGGLDLCGICRAQLPWNQHACRQCGIGLALAGQSHCGACRLDPPPFTHAFCPLHYRFPIDRLLPRFKFHGDLAAGELLATLMQWPMDPADLPQGLVPVPLHRSRLRTRGYDQALELARALARGVRLPLFANALVRRRATQPQTELGAAERRRNMRDAFALRPDARLPPHIALVDDVMTTGATLAECARVLLSSGVQRVDAWTIARA
jgi:ComF family protein